MVSAVESQGLPVKRLNTRLQSETHISTTCSVSKMKVCQLEVPDAGPTSSCSECDQESCIFLACDLEKSDIRRRDVGRVQGELPTECEPERLVASSNQGEGSEGELEFGPSFSSLAAMKASKVSKVSYSVPQRHDNHRQTDVSQSINFTPMMGGHSRIGLLIRV